MLILESTPKVLSTYYPIILKRISIPFDAAADA